MHSERGCPESTRWGAFLEGTLSEADQAVLVAHLDVCPSCRDRLDHNAAATDLLRGITPRVDRGQVPVDLVLEQALAELKAEAGPAPLPRTEPYGQIDPSGNDPDSNKKHDVANDPKIAELSFLSHSDDPTILGRLGDYKVTERIGRGGMGIVVKAVDPSLDRVVAIKVLAPKLADIPHARRRFTREARAAAAVGHDNVVTIHAVGEYGGLPYLVMQYVDGQSLQQKIDRRGPLGLDEILRIGMQMARGLAAAHEQGLVHRDIKPANIMLENSVERVKITDFGLARAIDDAPLTENGMVAGTPNYMSPEQARGDPVDRRTDLFSLGSTLYAMCTGQVPFRATSAVVVLRKVSDDRPKPIKSFSPETPDWLIAIVAKLQSKDPDDRYQSATEVADLLARHLAELQQPTRPATAKTIEPRSSGRRWMLPLASLVGTAVAIAALVLAVVGLNRTPPTSDPKVEAPDPYQLTRHSEPEPSTPAQGDRAPAPLLREQADRLLVVNELARAIELYSEAIRLDPADAVAFSRRADAYQGMGEYVLALADRTEVIELEPRTARPLVQRGLTHCWAGQPDLAISDFNDALKLQPDDSYRAYILHLRGWSHGLKKEWDLAIADYTSSLGFPTGDPYTALYALIGRANCRALTGRFDEALADFEQAFRLYPNDAASRSERAYYIHSARGDFDQAITECGKVLQRDPSSAPARLYRGLAYLRKGKADLAIADFDRTLNLNQRFQWTFIGPLFRHYPELHFGRGQAFQSKGQYARAISDYDEAIRLGREDAEVYQARGDAKAKLGDSKAAKADHDRAAQLGTRSDPNKKP